MLIPKLKKNITKMKSKISWSNHFISLAVSLIFIPLALLGQIGGNVIGNLLVWFNDYIAWWNFPNFIKIITSSFISGFVAGYFSAFIILKIYKKVIVNTATILPAALIIFAVLGDLSFVVINGFDLDTLGHFIRNGLTIYIYYSTLKGLKDIL